MAVYAIGDIQGCALPLDRLLDKIRFDTSKDTLWLTGDLVNRGPHSVWTLRLIRSLGSHAVSVLGNHDLHLLAIAERKKRQRAGDTLTPILRAHDRDELLDWLRHRPLAHCDKSLQAIMVHAGVYPGWSRKKLRKYAGEVEAVIRGPDYREFLTNMYGRTPRKWHPDEQGWGRLRLITNILTRMRYCDRKGNLNFVQKGPEGRQPKRYIPWYKHPDLKCRKWRIVFGHWSAQGFFCRKNIISLDSGCVWGGKLTAIRLDGNKAGRYWQVKCG